jgi:FkbM family methyltransferase
MPNVFSIMHLVQLIALVCMLQSISAQDTQNNGLAADPFSSRAMADLGNGMHIYRCDRGIFLLSDTDSIISRSLMQWGSYDDESLSLLLALIQPGDVVVDIGANIGTFTIPFANRVGMSGKVYAIEAMGINFHRLLGNVAMNSLSTQCRPMQFIMDTNERNGLPLHLPIVSQKSDVNMGSSNIPFIVEGAGVAQKRMSDTGSERKVVTERVMSRSLDSLFLEFDDKIEQQAGGKEAGSSRCPSLIKMDVEGMELPVLQGARTMLQQCRPAVHAENNCVMKSKPLIDFFDNIQYSCYWDVHKLHLHVSINMLCLPSEAVTESPVTERDKNIKYFMVGYTRVQPDRPYLSQYESPRYSQHGDLESCDMGTIVW